MKRRKREYEERIGDDETLTDPSPFVFFLRAQNLWCSDMQLLFDSSAF